MFLLIRFWLGNLTYRLIALYTIIFATYQIHALYDVAWLIAYFVTVNLVAFMVYFLDKLVAPIGRMPILKYIFNIRAPNSFLFWELGLLGGGVGALYGIHLNNHKTSDEYRWFRIQLWVISWIVFMGLLFLIWTSTISLAEINAMIGGVVSGLLQMGLWLATMMGVL